MGLLSKLNPFRSKAATKAKPQEFTAEMVANAARLMKGSYDAARTEDGLKNYWANADAFDADSAHSPLVRQTLVKRSRYELANNGYADGIAQTYATDLVGVGPALRMQTQSKGFNQLVERTWWEWTQAVHFRRKLWCMAHAKHGDGESLATLRLNPRIRHAIKLDVVLHETEQCASPGLAFNGSGIDGIPSFDQYGNPLVYEFLKHHPGSNNHFSANNDSELIAADRVLHWFKMRRPGQHRGVPECASTLNLGASFRRLREANLSTAEKVAAWTLMLKTAFEPSEDAAVSAAALSTLDIVHGMMTALPNTMEPVQLKAEQPGPQYDSFHKSLLNEQARPKSMPYNKAACDSSSYNYASGRLDHQTYYGSLDVDREDGNDLVLEPVFALWFDLAISKFGWLGGNPDAVSAGARYHVWDWPKHRVADVEAEANANKTKLESCQIGLHRLYSDAGMDLEDELEKMAETFGMEVDELRTRLVDVIFPPPKQNTPQASPASDPADSAVSAILKRLEPRGIPHANGNGAAYAN